jgi:hypothetical protein
MNQGRRAGGFARALSWVSAGLRWGSTLSVVSSEQPRGLGYWNSCVAEVGLVPSGRFRVRRLGRLVRDRRSRRDALSRPPLSRDGRGRAGPGCVLPGPVGSRRGQDDESVDSRPVLVPDNRRLRSAAPTPSRHVRATSQVVARRGHPATPGTRCHSQPPDVAYPRRRRASYGPLAAVDHVWEVLARMNQAAASPGAAGRRGRHGSIFDARKGGGRAA